MMKDEKTLERWQERFRRAESAWQTERKRMDRREELLEGSHAIVDEKGQKLQKNAKHVRNICFELIETQVDSNIPQPKVTAVRAEDEGKAKLIEDMLRNLLDRLPMERLNDEGERICPTQGGYAFLVDWFSGAMGRGWMGDVKLSLLHPRKIVPQDGIYQVAEMDYIFVKDAQTKEQIMLRYGVDVESEREEDPDVRSKDAGSTTDELVTMITAYYRNDEGGIGRVRWVGDMLLEDLEDYQARRVKRCRKCGAISDGIRCTNCGGKSFSEELQEYEELTEDIVTANGTVIPAISPMRDELGQLVMEDVGEPEFLAMVTDNSAILPQMQPGGMPAGVYSVRQEVRFGPTRIPYYKPDVFPIMLRKNVSRAGHFLGGSDIDAIADQQNAMNKLSTKINAKVLGGGSFVTVPKGLGRFISDEDNRKLEVNGPQDLQSIHVYSTQVDISADLRLRQEIYEESRQTLGVTDSLQGRKDTTATSAVAKEFSASQAAGRFESKRVMKKAVFQDLFETLFKFCLAYCDEPRPVVAYNEQGEREYKEFDRHDFLYQDDAGNWKYNTDFLFSCDSAAPLASDRTAMWKETRMNYQEGAFGNPSELGTLVRFWTIMDQLHYPTAAQVKADLQKELETQRADAQQSTPEQIMTQQGAAAMPQAHGESIMTPTI